ncbi:transposase [Streptomyces sp. WAC 04229]|uniref:transposase n=1 Tax=Streptomyces sp. WAC 04229 TaxID=2203206 RepID=UPI003D72FB73
MYSKYRYGLPLSLGVSGANMHDSQGWSLSCEASHPSGPAEALGGDGRRSCMPTKATATTTLRRWLRKQGIRHRIARRGADSSQRLGRHRWVVERTVSWLAGCRRLHRRYERKAESFLAFVGIAAALISYHRLDR